MKKMIWLVIGLLATCNREPEVTPVPLVAPREPKAEPKTCDEARPEYSSMVQAQQQAFEQERQKRGFVPAKLDTMWITDYRDQEPQYDQLLEAKIKQRRALIGMSFDRANG